MDPDKKNYIILNSKFINFCYEGKIHHYIIVIHNEICGLIINV